ncbi:MAG: VWA domain-containing protein, partial [Lentisphaeria bacterium]|nr:VWA domain-containing protein [Lentisphaeria bacterium]
MLHWLWLLPGLAALLFYAAYMRRLALSRLAQPEMRRRLLAGYSPGKRLLRQALFLLALLFLLLALARPAWNLRTETVKRHGRDVVFLLDVSRSMLAEDLKPNRLERAKLAIDDCIEVLSGDRVALVLFAGGSVLSCPLTQDY